MPRFAPLSPAPHYAVIFASQRRGEDAGYAAMAERMAALAETRPGFLGIDSARDAEGFGLTVSYWSDEAALLEWKQEARHLLAQKLGRERWYEHYTLRVVRVERGYEGPDGRAD